MTHHRPDRRSFGRSTVHTVTSGHETLLDPKTLRRLAESALLEDHAWQDVTTDPLVPDQQQGQAQIIARADGVLAGLDVFATEPLPADDPLTKLDNVVLAPHIGFNTPEAVVAMLDIAIDNLVAYFDGAPINVVAGPGR